MDDKEAPSGTRTSEQQPVTMQHIADKLDEAYGLARLGLQQTEDSTVSVQNAVFHQVERRIWDALTIARHHAEVEAEAAAKADE